MATINFKQDASLGKQISSLKASLKNLKANGMGDSPEAKAAQAKLEELQSQQTWRQPVSNLLDSTINSLNYQNTLRNANGKQLAQNNAQYKKLKQQYDSTTDEAEKESLRQRMSDIELSMNDIKQRNTPNYARLFAQGLSNWATTRDPTRGSAHLRSQGNLQLEEAAETQKAQQANAQIANQNYMVNADKEAAAQGAQKAMQTVRALGASAGAGAAALAANSNVEVSDYDSHRMRSDERRDRSVENMQDKYAAKNLAEQSYAGADTKDFDAAQTQQYNNMVNAASWGDDLYNTNSGSSTKDISTEEIENSTPDTKVTTEPTADPKSEEPETKSDYVDNSVATIKKDENGDDDFSEGADNTLANRAALGIGKNTSNPDEPKDDITLYRKMDVAGKTLYGKMSNGKFINGLEEKEFLKVHPSFNKADLANIAIYPSDSNMKNIIAGCFRRY